MPRKTMLADTLVTLADTLVADFDVIDLLTDVADSCASLLGVGAAGILLASEEGDLRVMASSNDSTQVLDLYEAEAREGPCLDCYKSGLPVLNADLAKADDDWPRFAPLASAAGFSTVHALPMRLRGTVIGVLTLFNAEPGEMNEDDAIAVQAMADVATIIIFQHRANLEAQLVNDQLNHALSSRVIIEQAKGVLAEREGVDMGQALTCMRAYARHHNRRLAAVAGDIVDGKLSTAELKA